MTMTKKQRENLHDRIAEDMRLALVEAVFMHLGATAAESMRGYMGWCAERTTRTMLRHYEIRDRRRRNNK